MRLEAFATDGLPSMEASSSHINAGVCVHRKHCTLQSSGSSSSSGRGGEGQGEKNPCQSPPVPAVPAGRRGARGMAGGAGPGQLRRALPARGRGRQSCAFPPAPGSGTRSGREQWGGGAAPGGGGRREGGGGRCPAPRPGRAPNNEAPAGEFPGQRPMSGRGELP